jgi:type II secretion system protein G
MLRNKEKGFTLVELLVVIAIIGILASIVLVSLNAARQRGRDARRIADLNQIRTGLETYFLDNGSYPDATSSLAPAYMSAVPADPGGTAYGYDNCGTGNNDFTLRATLETDNAALDNDIDTAACSGAGSCADGAFNYCVEP